MRIRIAALALAALCPAAMVGDRAFATPQPTNVR